MGRGARRGGGGGRRGRGGRVGGRGRRRRGPPRGAEAANEQGRAEGEARSHRRAGGGTGGSSYDRGCARAGRGARSSDAQGPRVASQAAAGLPEQSRCDRGRGYGRAGRDIQNGRGVPRHDRRPAQGHKDRQGHEADLPAPRHSSRRRVSLSRSCWRAHEALERSDR